MKTFLLLVFTVSLFAQEKVERFDYFVSVYDSIGTQKVEYYLTSDMVEKDRNLKSRAFRIFNGFHSSDYSNTGYDRGHLAPADSFSFDDKAHYDTYSLANVVPMKPTLNRQAWKYLEFYEKRIVKVHGCINVEIIVNYGSKKIGKLTIPKSFTKNINTCKGKVIGTFNFDNL